VAHKVFIAWKNGLKYYLNKICQHADDTNGLGLANKHGIPKRTWLINVEGLKREKNVYECISSS
jgi:peptide deformylase